MCDSVESCNIRFIGAGRIFMTSSMSPLSLTGKAILSIDVAENPAYYECNHLFVPYCSSDFWSGRSTVNPGTAFRFNGDSIFQAVVYGKFPHLL